MSCTFFTNTGKYFVVTAQSNYRILATLFGSFRKAKNQTRLEIVVANQIVFAIPTFIYENLDSIFHTNTEEKVKILSSAL